MLMLFMDNSICFFFCFVFFGLSARAIYAHAHTHSTHPFANLCSHHFTIKIVECVWHNCTNAFNNCNWHLVRPGVVRLDVVLSDRRPPSSDPSPSSLTFCHRLYLPSVRTQTGNKQTKQTIY